MSEFRYILDDFFENPILIGLKLMIWRFFDKYLICPPAGYSLACYLAVGLL